MDDVTTQPMKSIVRFAAGAREPEAAMVTHLLLIGECEKRHDLWVTLLQVSS